MTKQPQEGPIGKVWVLKMHPPKLDSFSNIATLFLTHTGPIPRRANGPCRAGDASRTSAAFSQAPATA